MGYNQEDLERDKQELWLAMCRCTNPKMMERMIKDYNFLVGTVRKSVEFDKMLDELHGL